MRKYIFGRIAGTNRRGTKESLKAYKTNNLSLNNFSNYFQKNLKG